MIVETSLLAFMDTVKERKTQEDVIYIHIDSVKESCIADISKALKMRTSSVAGRINSLYNDGWIDKVGKKKSESTNRLADYYKVNGTKKPSRRG